jgi:hypothetical protein
LGIFRQLDDGLGKAVDLNISRSRGQEKDQGDQPDLPDDGGPDGGVDHPFVHPHVHVPDHPRQDGGCDIYETAPVPDTQVANDGPILFPLCDVQDFRWDTRDERVGDEFVLIIHHKDVGHATSWIEELIDGRLDGRSIPVQQQLHAGVGNAFGNGGPSVGELLAQARAQGQAEKDGKDHSHQDEHDGDGDDAGLKEL